MKPKDYLWSNSNDRMIMFGSNKEPMYMNEGSPQYDLEDKGLYTTLSVGATMMALTIAGMLLIADTFIGELVNTLFVFPIVGVVAFGLLLTVGRQLGIEGVKQDSTLKAVGGSVILVLVYSGFGGGILTSYDPSLYSSAIVITGAITIAITLVASAYVYSTEKNLSHWSRYSGYIFTGVVVTALIGTFFEPLVLPAFGLAILGFFADLIYEIWMISNKNRSAYANGIALYVAFAGIFVHILQIVLESLSDG